MHEASGSGDVELFDFQSDAVGSGTWSGSFQEHGPGAAIPEPGSAAMILAGLGLATALRR